MAPAMPHARARPRAPSRLFPGYGELTVAAQCSSDNASALRSNSTAIFSRSTAIPMADSLAHRDHGLVR